ncbi:MAG: replicative DNA helicase [Methylacidiphilales bacterium]|nr:replicative DNA helicase [Candidatus Methylacidiphilales bacterium]
MGPEQHYSLLPHQKERNEDLKRLQQVEASLLGCLMQSELAWVEVFDKITVEDFSLTSHRQIFKAITQIAIHTHTFDVVAVADFLSNNNHLEQVGGLSYLLHLVSENPSAAHVKTYAQILKNASLLRALAIFGEKTTKHALYPEGESAKDIIRIIETDLMKIQEHGGLKSDVAHISAFSSSIREDIKRNQDRETNLLGISSGFPALDKITLGFQPGDLIVLAARPGHGKTALALNITQAVALNKLPVLFFSMEMSCKQLVVRLLSSLTNINHATIRSGKLQSQSDFDMIDKVLSLDEQEFPLFIEDASALTPLDLFTIARMVVRKHKLSFIVVDYIQLMSSNERENNRVNEIAKITRSLKQLAKEIQVPVLALSQLSREIEKRGREEPKLSDLRDSGTIEQDADIVLFIHQDEKDENKKTNYLQCKLIIAKHRNGPVGSISLEFNKPIVTFTSREVVPLPPMHSSDNADDKNNFERYEV